MSLDSVSLSSQLCLLSPLLSRGFLCVLGKIAVGSLSLSSSRHNSTGLRPTSSHPAAAREEYEWACCGHVTASGLSLCEGAGECWLASLRLRGHVCGQKSGRVLLEEEAPSLGVKPVYPSAHHSAETYWEPHCVLGTVLSSLFPNLQLMVGPQSYWLTGASLVAQWWRIRLPMQEAQVQSLVWEDPTWQRN